MVKFLIFQRRRILQSVCQNEVRSSILLTWWNFSFFNEEGFYKASVRTKYGVPYSSTHGEIFHFSTKKDFTKRLLEWSMVFHTPHMVKFLIFQRRRILQNVSQNEVRFHTPQHGEISHFSTKKDFTKRLLKWSKDFHTPHMVKFLIFQRRRILQSVCQNEVRSFILLTWWNFSFFNAEGFYKESVRMK